jgi:hypothetical protein
MRKLVEVVIVASEPAKSDEIPGADMADHLARHGAKVELERDPHLRMNVALTRREVQDIAAYINTLAK